MAARRRVSGTAWSRSCPKAPRPRPARAGRKSGRSGHAVGRRRGGVRRGRHRRGGRRRSDHAGRPLVRGAGRARGHRRTGGTGPIRRAECRTGSPGGRMRNRLHEGATPRRSVAGSGGRGTRWNGDHAARCTIRSRTVALSYGGDPLDDDTLAYVVDPVRCVEDTVHHYFQPVRWSGVTGVSITYVVNERDRPIPTRTQEEMARRLPPPPPSSAWTPGTSCRSRTPPPSLRYWLESPTDP